MTVYLQSRGTIKVKPTYYVNLRMAMRENRAVSELFDYFSLEKLLVLKILRQAF